MASCKECKDCLHIDVCYRIQVEGIPKCTDTKYCKEFKDRSRFVELPCKVGDALYEICERKRSGEWKKAIVERTVHGIEIGIGGYTAARCGTSIIISLSNLGKTVFLSREEAEQALKESENNG